MCPCVEWLFLPVSPIPPPVHLSVSVCVSGCFFNNVEVKEEDSGKVSVVLAADALTGWVLGGLNCDGHYVGGWWEVWVASPWHLPLWHDVVDGCDGEKGEREWVMCKMPINPANSGTYCDKDKQHGKTEQQLFYPDSWQQRRILSILNWHRYVMWLYQVSFSAFPRCHNKKYILHLTPN